MAAPTPENAESKRDRERRIRGELANPWLAARLANRSRLDGIDTTLHTATAEGSVPYALVSQVHWAEDANDCPLPIKATLDRAGIPDMSGGFMTRIGGMDTPTPKGHLLVREFALLLGIKESHVRRLIKKGILHSTQYGGIDSRHYIEEPEVRRYLSKLAMTEERRTIVQNNLTVLFGHN